jgi:outer membrane receptor protein involved in Fe transport
MRTLLRKLKISGSTVALLSISAFPFGNALAQPADASPPANATAATEEVVVTGSRIARKGFETPTPVTTISAADLEAKQPTTLNDIVADIPELRPTQQLNGSGDVNISAFNLRDIGQQRTLTLINGKRAVASSPAGGFDINSLPAALVSRVEVVTAGASAVYGSDALAGVVNIFLKNDIKGLHLSAEAGESTYGDAESVTLNAAYGMEFAGGRGHFEIAGSIYRKPNIQHSGDRSWGQGWILLTNSAYTPTNGKPAFISATNGRLGNMTNGGLIISPNALKGINFGANGTQSAFNFGTNNSGVWTQGGDGPELELNHSVIAPKSMRDNFYSTGSYDIDADTQVNLELMFSRSEGQDPNVPNYDASLPINRQNAYLPANIAAIMDANHLTSFNMGRITLEGGDDFNTATYIYQRGSLGVKGKVFGDWNWNVDGTYTRTLRSQKTYNNRNLSKWANSVDSVIGPGGTAMCRSTLTDPGNGCVPANVFGLDSVSPGAIAYTEGTSWAHGHVQEINIDANIAGTPFSTWAGPVAVVAGFQYRSDDVVLATDPVAAALGWRQTTALPYTGHVDVKEGYTEASVPLLVNQPFAQDVEMDLAARAVEYSTSGQAEVWKLGLNWTVNDQIRFRSTYSRDFRAPNLDELFSAPVRGSGSVVIDRATGANVAINSLSGGNPLLKPEKAYTKTIGVVLKPDFFPNFSISADYYNININQAIATATVQQVEDNCFKGDPVYCNFITRNPTTNVITQIQTTSFNSQQTKTDGIDMEASYNFDLADIDSDLGGQVSLGEMATWVDNLQNIAGTTITQYAGQLNTSGVPHWRTSTNLTYRNEDWTVRFSGNFVGGAKYDNTYACSGQALSIDKCHYDPYFYVDGTVSYDFTQAVSGYVKVNNIFNIAPPIFPVNNLVIRANASSQAYYPQLGRMFFVGIRADMDDLVP